jgi:hypothetical protein
MAIAHLPALVAGLALMPAVASAAVLDTVDATFDPFLQNTELVIDNLTGKTQTGAVLTTSLGPTTSVSLGALAAGLTTYYFNQVDGGFLVGAGENDVPDSTTYQLTVAGVSSGVFSPGTNLTGAYVDFLGNTCFGYSAGCLIATSGIVAEVVPEPTSVGLMGAAVLAAGGAFAARRRAR